MHISANLVELIGQCLKPLPGQCGPLLTESAEIHKPDSGKRTLPALTRAAVLVPLVERPGTVMIMLTIRTKHLHHHPGQISFPGGCVEPNDTDVVSTALREAREEIGVAPSHVQVIGCLDNYRTVTGFIITPIVGILKPGFKLTLDTFEVAKVFEIPLWFALDPANHQRRQVFYAGRRRAYYVVEYAGREIWGATAGILVNFSKKIRTHRQIYNLSLIYKAQP